MSRRVANGLYAPPRSLKEWRKIVWLENLNVNLSKVPDKELKVIHYYTQWTAFTDKGSINADFLRHRQKNDHRCV
jgi:hypothetical protein